MPNDLFSKNYFEIFEIPVAFDVDLSKVGDAYRELQKEVHPDKFVNESEQQRRIAMQLTSLINEALKTIEEPILRAQYLLKLKGIDMESDTDTSMDAAFLMEQMEFRETIAEVRGKDDPLHELDQMTAELKQKLKALTNDFQKHYSDSSLKQARDAIRKMQFIIKAQKEVDEISEQLEDELI
ncbi:MAG: Fe-S protein assembly co-chaperone HscB [Gammaproteobacteria bacterium]|nr:Fe-S protein assembly co-chaperone HscB [Gammaproteobacteria bacterium]